VSRLVEALPPLLLPPVAVRRALLPAHRRGWCPASSWALVPPALLCLDVNLVVLCRCEGQDDGKGSPLPRMHLRRAGRRDLLCFLAPLRWQSDVTVVRRACFRLCALESRIFVSVTWVFPRARRRTRETAAAERGESTHTASAPLFSHSVFAVLLSSLRMHTLAAVSIVDPSRCTVDASASTCYAERAHALRRAGNDMFAVWCGTIH
jgi:hypothetical protein